MQPSTEYKWKSRRQYMKVSKTLTDNETIKLIKRQILLDTKAQYMKESNTLDGNMTIKKLQMYVLLDKKEQIMNIGGN